LKPTAKPVLERAKAYLDQNPGTYYLDGHTDWIGSNQYNFSLGQKRAESVYHALVALGVHEDVLIPRSFGESRPFTTNETDAGRSLNRRVELIRQSNETPFDY
ncbi:MAG: OmpA family protein, partial [Candidatus Lindowbacteria bacterium]|nr:OmpA family protein [Candidatus Lindowbacteria bacterium]